NQDLAALATDPSQPKPTVGTGAGDTGNILSPHNAPVDRSAGVGPSAPQSGAGGARSMRAAAMSPRESFASSMQQASPSPPSMSARISTRPPSGTRLTSYAREIGSTPWPIPSSVILSSGG